jgi:hypothetical protein
MNLTSVISQAQNAKAEYVYTASTSTTLASMQEVTKKNPSSQRFANTKLIYYYYKKLESTGHSPHVNINGTHAYTPTLTQHLLKPKLVTTYTTPLVFGNSGVARLSIPMANYVTTLLEQGRTHRVWADGHGLATAAKVE